MYSMIMRESLGARTVERNAFAGSQRRRYTPPSRRSGPLGALARRPTQSKAQNCSAYTSALVIPGWNDGRVTAWDGASGMGTEGATNPSEVEDQSGVIEFESVPSAGRFGRHCRSLLDLSPVPGFGARA